MADKIDRDTINDGLITVETEYHRTSCFSYNRDVPPDFTFYVDGELYGISIHETGRVFILRKVSPSQWSVAHEGCKNDSMVRTVGVWLLKKADQEKEGDQE